MKKDKNLAAVDPERFKFCFALSGAAADGKDPQFKFNPKPIRLGSKMVVLTDQPLNRWMLALLEQCDSTKEFRAMARRMLALAEIIPELLDSPYLRMHEGRLEIHNSVLELAAVFPLIDDKFDLDGFIKALQKIKEQEG
jgi:hypothetical protein